MSDLRAIIVAAGRGSRLGPSGSVVPKCLTHLSGEALLDHQLRALAYLGVADITVVGGYEIVQLANRGLRLVENREWASTTMVDSIKCGISSYPDFKSTLILYGDIYICERGLVNVNRVTSDLAVGYIRGWKENWRQRYEHPLDDLETFGLNSEDALIEIGGTPESFDDIAGQFAGVLYFSKDGIESFMNLEYADKAASTTHLLAMMLEHRVEIGTFAIPEPWFEIDTLQDLEYARSTLEGS